MTWNISCAGLAWPPLQGHKAHPWGNRRKGNPNVTQSDSGAGMGLGGARLLPALLPPAQIPPCNGQTCPILAENGLGSCHGLSSAQGTLCCSVLKTDISTEQRDGDLP